LEFRAEVNHEETSVMGLSYSEDCIYAPTNSILTATYGTLQILHYDDDDDDPIILA